MSDNRETLLLGFLGDCLLQLPGETGVDLEKVDAALLQAAHISPGIFLVVNQQA